jgi:hypothetical protein
MAEIRIPYQWETANFTWNVAPTNRKETRYTWDDVALVQQILPRPDDDGEVVIRGRGPDEDYVHPLFKDEKKKKRLIKLIYKTQGKVLKEEKEIKEIKVTVKDVKILAKEVLGINVKIL